MLYPKYFIGKKTPENKSDYSSKRHHQLLLYNGVRSIYVYSYYIAAGEFFFCSPTFLEILAGVQVHSIRLPMCLSMNHNHLCTVA